MANESSGEYTLKEMFASIKGDVTDIFGRLNAIDKRLEHINTKFEIHTSNGNHHHSPCEPSIKALEKVEAAFTKHTDRHFGFIQALVLIVASGVFSALITFLVAK